MAELRFKTPDEIQAELGTRIRNLRLRKGLTQEGVASRADISSRALRSLEVGGGSSLLTLVKVLKALDALDGLEAFAPKPTVSPMAMLAGNASPKRGKRS